MATVFFVGWIQWRSVYNSPATYGALQISFDRLFIYLLWNRTQGTQ